MSTWKPDIDIKPIDLGTVTTTEACRDLLLEAYRGANAIHILHAENLRCMGTAQHARLVERATTGSVRAETDRAVSVADMDLRASWDYCLRSRDAINLICDHYARLFAAEASAQASLFPPPMDP